MLKKPCKNRAFLFIIFPSNYQYESLYTIPFAKTGYNLGYRLRFWVFCLWDDW